MRILIDALSARYGGGVTYIHSLLPALVREGGDHEFHVLLSSRYQSDIIEGLPREIMHVEADLPETSLHKRLWYLQVGLPRMLRQSAFDLLFTVAEVGTFRAPCKSVSLVRNANLFYSANSGAPLLSRLKRIADRTLRRPFVLLSLRCASRLAFVSDALRDDVNSRMSFDRSKTCVIHHGVSGEFQPISSEPESQREFGSSPYLLTVATITQHKNLDVLLQAFARVVEQKYSDLRLLIAGAIQDQSLFNRLQSRANELGVTERVQFLGHVPIEKLPSLYRGSKAFIMSSTIESFGQILVEAMACGVPVITTDLPVCRELCGEASLFFRPQDVETLTAHIQRVLSQPDLRDSMIKKGLVRSRDFSWDITAAKLVDLFEETAGVGHGEVAGSG